MLPEATTSRPLPVARETVLGVRGLGLNSSGAFNAATHRTNLSTDHVDGCYSCLPKDGPHPKNLIERDHQRSPPSRQNTRDEVKQHGLDVPTQLSCADFRSSGLSFGKQLLRLYLCMAYRNKIRGNRQHTTCRKCWPIWSIISIIMHLTL